jgi:hypothetical protein
MAVLRMPWFTEETEMVGYWVIAMASPWMTAEQTASGKIQAPQHSMLLYRFHGVLGTSGGVAARWRRQRRNKTLIETDGEDEEATKHCLFSQLFTNTVEKILQFAMNEAR